MGQGPAVDKNLKSVFCLNHGQCNSCLSHYYPNYMMSTFYFALSHTTSYPSKTTYRLFNTFQWKIHFDDNCSYNV